jgi:hypothetical protein
MVSCARRRALPTHQSAGQAMHPIGIVEAEVAGSVGGVHGDELDRAREV